MYSPGFIGIKSLLLRRVHREELRVLQPVHYLHYNKFEVQRLCTSNNVKLPVVTVLKLARLEVQHPNRGIKTSCIVLDSLKLSPCSCFFECVVRDFKFCKVTVLLRVNVLKYNSPGYCNVEFGGVGLLKLVKLKVNPLNLGVVIMCVLDC